MSAVPSGEQTADAVPGFSSGPCSRGCRRRLNGNPICSLRRLCRTMYWSSPQRGPGTVVVPSARRFTGAAVTSDVSRPAREQNPGRYVVQASCAHQVLCLLALRRSALVVVGSADVYRRASGLRPAVVRGLTRSSRSTYRKPQPPGSRRPKGSSERRRRTARTRSGTRGGRWPRSERCCRQRRPGGCERPASSGTSGTPTKRTRPGRLRSGAPQFRSGSPGFPMPQRGQGRSDGDEQIPASSVAVGRFPHPASIRKVREMLPFWRPARKV
jgi:hypothetical protein